MLGFIFQNDVFLAVILNVVLSFPSLRYFWDPATGLTLSKQRASIPRIGAAQTTTFPPQPTTFTPISTLPPKPVTLTETITLIVYDTVQGQLTCTSTVTDGQQVTTRAHYPTDSATPPENSIHYCTEVGLYEPKSKFQTWPDWAMLFLPITLLGMLYLAFRSGFVITRVPAVEGQIEEMKIDPGEDKKSKREWDADARDMSNELEKSRQEMQRLMESVEKRDAMLKCLGVFKDNDTAPDEESLEELVKNRKESLEANENSLRMMQADITDCLEKIKGLEAEKPKMVEDIKNQCDQHYAVNVIPKYQRSLDDKQGEIKYWRAAFFNNEKDEAMKENYQLCEDKEAELAQLRILPAQISDLEHDLRDATKQIETLQQEKKDQGVADRRRWMLEKDDLCKKHAEVTKALRIELKEAKKLSKETSRAQQDSSAGSTADKKQVESLKKEHEAMMAEASNLRKQIEDVNKIVSEVVQDFEKVSSERDGLKEALEKLGTGKAVEEKANEK